jgi:hypothetical protein
VSSSKKNTIAVPFAAGDSFETVTIVPSTGTLSGSSLSLQLQVVQDSSITGNPATYSVGDPNTASVSLLGL